MKRGNKKTPRRQLTPPSGKQVRSEKQKHGSDGLKIRWSFSIIDKDGPWGFEKISADEFWNKLLPKLRHYGNMTWADLFNHRHNHSVDKKGIIKGAEKRLKEIDQDDIDQLVSIAINGKPRLWGIRQNDEFRFLWWDPHHKIWPTTK
jgi:hypothetical protein